MSAPATIRPIDLSRNKRQADFFDAVMMSAFGGSPFRFFGYGGAIRGGKSYVSLFCLLMLARHFDGSRWHVVRKDFPTLMDTAIPSMEKLAPQGAADWYRNPSNYHLTLRNSSKIFFMGENIARDPDLLAFLGLETNGLLLEQAEELHPRLWDRAVERTGSWYIPNMPPGLVLTTFNPTNRWPRPKFHEPYSAGTLKAPYFYQPALPKDNPFVTQDQWAAWEQMDPMTYRRQIEGDWDAYRTGQEFYHAFSRLQHVKPSPYRPDLPVHLSFDQNVVPYITLTCWQMERTPEGRFAIWCFREFCLEHPRNNTEALCKAFLAHYPDCMGAFLYGDASGNKRDTRGSETDYSIAKKELHAVLHSGSDRTMRQNPPVIRKRDFMNDLLAGKKYPVDITIDPSCQNLVVDLLELKQDANGHKLKEKESNEVTGVKAERLGHTSDSGDYLMVSALKSDWERHLKGK